jgi:hypothetical protein
MMNRYTGLAAWMLLVACVSNDGSTDTQVDEMTELVVRQAVHEPLESIALQRKICAAIRKTDGPAGIPGNCPGFTYMVTELARSSTYVTKESGEPVVMELEVTVAGPGEGRWSAVLTRKLGPDYRLVFDVAIGATTAQAERAHILALASAAGEYFDPEDADISPHVRRIDRGRLPANVAAIVDAAEAGRTKQIQDWTREDDPEGESFAELTACHEILHDGIMSGYAVSLDDYVRAPGWDGSGVTLYYDRSGNLVTSVEWTA